MYQRTSLEAQISINPNIVKFVVDYATIEEVAEGLKAKNVAALSSTVASVPARKYVFGLTDVNARVGKGLREAGKQAARCWVHMA